MFSAENSGVYINPLPVTMGEQVKISYNGMLAKKRADKVYAHIGYGKHEQWKNIEDIPMKYTEMGWVCNLSTVTSARVNLCFHDGTGNWDNNGGHNWSFSVHNGALQ